MSEKLPRSCLAIQYSDQMICSACGLGWDVNDPDPPMCKKIDKRLKSFKEAVLFEKPADKVKGLPDVLPDAVAIDMVKTFVANGGSISGMKAAYRLMLDRIEP